MKNLIAILTLILLYTSLTAENVAKNENGTFPIPQFTELFKESKTSSILMVNEKDSLVASLYDIGWDGAVDGPMIVLDISNFINGKKLKRIDFGTDFPAFTSKSTDKKSEWVQFHINESWGKEKHKIDSILYSYNFKAEYNSPLVKRVEASDVGLTLKFENLIDAFSDKATKIKSLKSIFYKEKIVWKANQEGILIVFDTPKLVQIGNVLRVTIDSDNIYDCCDESEEITIHL